MSLRELPWLRAIAGGLVALLVVGVVTVVRGSSASPPDVVQPIDWNREPCAHCRMLIGDPAHASQLITTSGEVLAFDDPGCALRYLHQHAPAVHRLWFHHATAERWLSAGEVAFRRGGDTPMGSGLLAVEAGAPDTIDLAAARELVATGAP